MNCTDDMLDMGLEVIKQHISSSYINGVKLNV